MISAQLCDDACLYVPLTEESYPCPVEAVLNAVSKTDANADAVDADSIAAAAAADDDDDIDSAATAAADADSVADA